MSMNKYRVRPGVAGILIAALLAFPVAGVERGPVPNVAGVERHIGGAGGVDRDA